MIFLILKMLKCFWFLFAGRTEEAAANQARAGSGGGGDPQDGVDLVDDHVPDQADEEVLHQAPVDHLPGLGVLGRDGAGEGEGADEETNQERLDHLGVEAGLTTESQAWPSFIQLVSAHSCQPWIVRLTASWHANLKIFLVK